MKGSLAVGVSYMDWLVRLSLLTGLLGSPGEREAPAMSSLPAYAYQYYCEEEPIERRTIFSTWKAASYTGQWAGKQQGKTAPDSPRPESNTFFNKKRGLIHRRDFPPPPRLHSGLKNNPMGERFEQAEQDHLESHKEMKTWEDIVKSDSGHKTPKC